MTKKYALQSGLLIVTITSLISCSMMPFNNNNDTLQTYLLQDIQNIPTAAAPTYGCSSLRIARPTSSPGFRTARMAYMTVQNRLDYFAYHEWVDAPATMLASIIEQRLETDRIFSSVLSGSTDIKTDWRLDLNLLALYQDFTTAQQSRIVFKVKVSLLDLHNRILIDTKTFEYIVNTEINNAEAGVTAANKAVVDFLTELNRFIWKAASKTECNSG